MRRWTGRAVILPLRRPPITQPLRAIAVTDSKITGTGTTQITINPAATQIAQTEYYVLIDATAFDDTSSNSFAGISSTTALSFTTEVTTISQVNSDKSAGSYKVGEAININIGFSGNVTVSGTPQITLETGSTDRVVNYSSGSGSNTLTFVYTVQAGDTSADLNYASTGALALNSGTIVDSFNENAILTLPGLSASASLAGNEALVIDTTLPTLSSSSPADRWRYRVFSDR